jgi:ankyrin repeat protein
MSQALSVSLIEENNFVGLQELLAAGGIFWKDDCGRTLLHYAALHNNVEVVRLLIENGADINARDKWKDTPLHYALPLFEGGLEAARLLIEAGADVSAQGRYGDTPLHHVVLEGYIDIARMLIERGADPNIEGRWGDTPLKLAIDEECSEIIELLLSKPPEIA